MKKLESDVVKNLYDSVQPKEEPVAATAGRSSSKRSSETMMALKELDDMIK